MIRTFYGNKEIKLSLRIQKRRNLGFYSNCFMDYLYIVYLDMLIVTREKKN